MADALLDLAGFRSRTVMPSEDVDAVEERAAGFIDARLLRWSARIRAQLAKRYDVTFPDPVPEVVLGWLVDIVTPEAYRKRGWNPADDQVAQIEQDRKDALTEIAQAADSVTGLFELPVRQDTTADGVVKGGPFVYSEQSPYTWADLEQTAGRGEDTDGH